MTPPSARFNTGNMNSGANFEYRIGGALTAGTGGLNNHYANKHKKTDYFEGRLK